VIKIEARVVDLRLCGVNRSQSPLLISGALINDIYRGRLLLAKLFGSLEFPIGKGEPGVRGLKRGVGLRQLDLIGLRIDREEKIALMNDVSVLEMNARQSPADLRSQFDLFHGRELA
jgi:hypothetical protein